MLESFELRLETDKYVRQPLWIIGPRSYFSDRAVPLIDITAVPARLFEKETLRLLGDNKKSVTSNYHSRRYKILHSRKAYKLHEGKADTYYVDLRIFGLQNWSHFLNKAVPVAIIIREELIRMGQRDPVYILDKKVFPAIIEMMERLGLNLICTNNKVRAAQIAIEASNYSIIDTLSRDIISPIENTVDEMVDGVPDIYSKQVFLNRKPPFRSIINSQNIKKELNSYGYVEYFMEDYSAAEQIAIILRASKIISIHGAALAPLMFRNKNHGPLQMVEIVPPGHVVPFFRDMITDVPCTYRMVRGVPDAAMVSDAFSDVDTPSMKFTKKHSLRQFYLDPASLRFAISSLDDMNFPFDSINRPSGA